MALVVLVVASLPILFAVKRGVDSSRAERQASEQTQQAAERADEEQPQRSSLIEPGNGRPMLLDLGATTCAPCRAMQPILEELRREYYGRVTVQFVDVYEHQDWAEKYRVYLIPLQVFISANGKELYRHEGYLAKEDILRKFNELGWAK